MTQVPVEENRNDALVVTVVAKDDMDIASFGRANWRFCRMDVRDQCTWQQCVTEDNEGEELADLVDSSSDGGLGWREGVTPASESDLDSDCDQCMPCYGLFNELELHAQLYPKLPMLCE